MDFSKLAEAYRNNPNVIAEEFFIEIQEKYNFVHFKVFLTHWTDKFKSQFEEALRKVVDLKLAPQNTNSKVQINLYSVLPDVPQGLFLRQDRMQFFSFFLNGDDIEMYLEKKKMQVTYLDKTETFKFSGFEEPVQVVHLEHEDAEKLRQCLANANLEKINFDKLFPCADNPLFSDMQYIYKKICKEADISSTASFCVNENTERCAKYVGHYWPPIDPEIAKKNRMEDEEYFEDEAWSFFNQTIKQMMEMVSQSRNEDDWEEYLKEKLRNMDSAKTTLEIPFDCYFECSDETTPDTDDYFVIDHIMSCRIKEKEVQLKMIAPLVFKFGPINVKFMPEDICTIEGTMLECDRYLLSYSSVENWLEEIYPTITTKLVEYLRDMGLSVLNNLEKCSGNYYMTIRNPAIAHRGD